MDYVLWEARGKIVVNSMCSVEQLSSECTDLYVLIADLAFIHQSTQSFFFHKPMIIRGSPAFLGIIEDIVWIKK